MAKGVLGFQYEADASNTGLTSLSGLPLYLDLIHAIGLATAVRQRVRVAGAQGRHGIQVVQAGPLPAFGAGRLRAITLRQAKESGVASLPPPTLARLRLRSP